MPPLSRLLAASLLPLAVSSLLLPACGATTTSPTRDASALDASPPLPEAGDDAAAPDDSSAPFDAGPCSGDDYDSSPGDAAAFFPPGTSVTVSHASATGTPDPTDYQPADTLTFQVAAPINGSLPYPGYSYFLMIHLTCAVPLNEPITLTQYQADGGCADLLEGSGVHAPGEPQMVSGQVYADTTCNVLFQSVTVTFTQMPTADGQPLGVVLSLDGPVEAFPPDSDAGFQQVYSVNTTSTACPL